MMMILRSKSIGSKFVGTKSFNSRFMRLAASLLAAMALGLMAGCGGGGDDPMEPEPPGPLPDSNVLQLPDAQGAAGTTVQLSLSLENVVALSGLEFDLDFDPGTLTITGAAPGARSTGFDADFHVEAGTAHILLVDLGGSATIAAGDGEVAIVTVDVDLAATGSSPLLVDNATAVDTNATTFSVGGSAATFTIP